LQPGNTLGNYQIVEKIGAGGMGSVYKAYQPGLGRFVAIKVLPPQTAGDPAFAERFAQEARAVGKLRHANIVTAFDFTQQDDVAYLVADYIDGGTLADQLGTALPLDYALGILGPLAAALDYAHARGVVHRDIKPQNVLLTREGTPLLTDFGLAKIVGPGSGMTQAGSLMGTADYMAPELAGGAESAGPAADQYALGIIAYQLLVGRHPFPSDNPLSALMAHVNKPVPLPSQLGVVLAPGVEAALLRALSKKPEDRFARCGDFARALVGSQFGQPGQSPSTFIPPSTSPSQPPVVFATPAAALASPFASPSDLVSPVARVQPPPPTAPVPAAPLAGPLTLAPAGAGAVAAVTLVPNKGTPFPWRRAIVPGVLVLVLAILALRGGTDRGAAVDRTSAPQRTAQQTLAPTVAPTVAPTAAPTLAPTVAPTLAATIAPTIAPTVAPTVRPSTAAAPVADDEPNNTALTASVITMGTYGGTIAPPDDVDFFRIMVPDNTTLALTLRADTLPNGAVALFNTSGVEVAPEVNTGADRVARIDYVVRDPGAYFIRVRAARTADLTGTYTLNYSATR
jgi:serine/threonine-protein kinase